MTITCFEDIVAWQKAQDLTTVIYRDFKHSRDYAFRDQIQRASVSIMNNIAEGFERRSNKEFRQFLFISKGSCGEVRSMLRLAENLGYLEKERCRLLVAQSSEISKMLTGLIKVL